MRTTLTIDDEIAAALKKRAFESGKSFKQVVNEALAAGLAGSLPRARVYRLMPVSMGQAQQGINLDKASRIAGEMEDEELARKLDQRK